MMKKVVIITGAANGAGKAIAKNEIYNSKFIQSLIFFIINCIVILVILFITYILSQGLVVLCLFIIALFNSNIMKLFKTNAKISPN